MAKPWKYSLKVELFLNHWMSLFHRWFCWTTKMKLQSRRAQQFSRGLIIILRRSIHPPALVSHLFTPLNLTFVNWNIVHEFHYSHEMSLVFPVGHNGFCSAKCPNLINIPIFPPCHSSTCGQIQYEHWLRQLKDVTLFFSNDDLLQENDTVINGSLTSKVET